MPDNRAAWAGETTANSSFMKMASDVLIKSPCKSVFACRAAAASRHDARGHTVGKPDSGITRQGDPPSESEDAAPRPHEKPPGPLKKKHASIQNQETPTGTVSCTSKADGGARPEAPWTRLQKPPKRRTRLPQHLTPPLFPSLQISSRERHSIAFGVHQTAAGSA